MNFNRPLTDKMKAIFLSFRDMENGAYYFKDDEKIFQIILEQNKEIEKDKAIRMLILAGYKILKGETDFFRILVNIEGYANRLERDLDEEGATDREIREQNEFRKCEFKKLKKQKEEQERAVRKDLEEEKQKEEQEISAKQNLNPPNIRGKF